MNESLKTNDQVNRDAASVVPTPSLATTAAPVQRMVMRFAIVFLFVSLVATHLMPDTKRRLLEISPIVEIAYLLLLVGCLYELRSLWLCLWRNLRSGLHNMKL
jgi:uncharacterized membrane protein YtjA (UPF0391 family)